MLTLCKNPGLFCAQACIKIILKHYYPKRGFSLQELAKLSYKRKNGVTDSLGIILVFDKLGLKVKGFTEKLELNKRYKQEKSLHDCYKKYSSSKKIQAKLIKETKLKKLVNIKKLEINDIEKFLKKKYLIILLLNWATIKNKKGYRGHFIILNSIDSKEVSIVNVGPKKPSLNYRIPRNKFVKAWHSKGTDSDAIVISGKK